MVVISDINDIISLKNEKLTKLLIDSINHFNAQGFDPSYTYFDCNKVYYLEDNDLVNSVPEINLSSVIELEYQDESNFNFYVFMITDSFSVTIVIDRTNNQLINELIKYRF